MEKFFDCFGKSMRSIIAFIVTLLCFVFLFYLCRKAIPEMNKEVIYIAVGIVLGTFKDITGYYFGSSKDKSDRDKADIKSEQV